MDQNHIVLVVDENSAILRAQKSFSKSPSGAILCDRNELSVIHPEFTVSVCVGEFTRGRDPVIRRIYFDAAPQVARPTP